MDILKLAINAKMVGSRYICKEPRSGADHDLLILFHPFHLPEVVDNLIANGWFNESESDDYDIQDFWSWRKGKDNYIICWDEEFYWRFVRAAEVCRYLHVTDKEQRINVHKEIIFGGHLRKLPRRSM